MVSLGNFTIFSQILDRHRIDALPITTITTKGPEVKRSATSGQRIAK
jgi:hypothetical protein